MNENADLTKFKLEDLFEAYSFLFYKLPNLNGELSSNASTSLDLIKSEIKSRPDAFEFMWKEIYGNK